MMAVPIGLIVRLAVRAAISSTATGRGESSGDNPSSAREVNKAEALRLAKSFRDYLRQVLYAKSIGMTPKSPFTKLIHTANSNRPIVHTSNLIDKYVVFKELADGYSVGFDLKALYSGNDLPVRWLLDVLTKGTTITKSQVVRKRVARWMAITLTYAGMRQKRGTPPSTKKIKIPPRPFFQRAAEKFIAKNSRDGRVFKITGYRLSIRVYTKKRARKTKAMG